MVWSKERGRARQSEKLPTSLRRKVITRDRKRGSGCYFQFLDICQGIDGAVEVHHIIEVADGGGDHEGNLATACKPCHARWSARQAQKRAVKAGNEWKRGKENHPGILD
jgi:5-methylcytosine-specific restriction endonuclease McrA